MYTECSSDRLAFQELGPRKVEGDFDGGTITSDAGGLLLREVDATAGYLSDFADCFVDYRHPDYIEHSVFSLVSQRVMGICLGYEDLNDHEQLRYDPLFASLCGKVDPTGQHRKRQEDRGKALAGKSTLNRLETAPLQAGWGSRYKKVVYDAERIERYFVEKFIGSYRRAPQQIVLDLDPTDDRLYGHQEGRFFHAFYDCYCYLPLYIFCGDELLCAKLRRSNIDASAGAKQEVERIVNRIRAQWPKVQILLRGDSGFCREELMGWSERTEGVDYLFGLARNERLKRRIAKTMKKVRRKRFRTGKSERRYVDLRYRTLDSWSRSRRVVAKVEYLLQGENPRFVVTSLRRESIAAQELYESGYCPRGDMENRIKEQQLYLFADRTSSETMRANQLRLWFSSVAYLLMNRLRKVGLQGTEFARAQCHTIRLKLLKIGAQVRVSVRRLHISLASGYPYQRIFVRALNNLKGAYPLRR